MKSKIKALTAKTFKVSKEILGGLFNLFFQQTEVEKYKAEIAYKYGFDVTTKIF